MKVSKDLYFQAHLICLAYLNEAEIQERAEGEEYGEPETLSYDGNDVQIIALNSPHYEYRVKP